VNFSDLCRCGHERRLHTKPTTDDGEWGMCWAKPYWHPNDPRYWGNDCKFFEVEREYIAVTRGPDGHFAKAEAGRTE